ncbi:MORN repeat protein [Neolewinella xylanilytica]|uniref:MORN repeat protein n=1 Tax=Neolewinella xylanilytica TaxID=1514080 RepID=A0A2S6HZU8_9BACT|nr:PD40 domain-containing protein [Neolewinella xylanilytica]PPK84048.1 MORN repeat protein [Neolewinella xylanilytica]
MVLLTGYVDGQTGSVAENYPDGSPKLYHETKDSLPDGRWTEWYPDGTLRYRAEWRRGKGHGRWEYFYPNGVLRSDEVFENDLPVGISRIYHPNGQLAEESVYVAGKRHGIRTTYSPTGVPERIRRYRNGERIIDHPEEFAPGILSTEADEWGLSFTPSGDTIYFTRRLPEDRRQRIYRSRLTDTGWTTPLIVPFSTDTDESPFVTRDGRWIYFASFRPLPGQTGAPKNDMNLWRVRRSNGNYETATPVSGPLNRTRKDNDPWPYAYEAGPHLGAEGSLYYWSALARGGSADLLRSDPDPAGNFGPPVALTAVNTPAAESGPALSPDGNYLLFSSYGRTDGFGMEDLYVARRTATGYGDAVNLGPLINGPGNEGCATFSPDGAYFYFCRDAGEGTSSNLYYLETAYLPLPR